MFRNSNMLILKTTRGCNINCSYCYVRNKENYINERFDFDLYTKVIDRIVAERLTSNKPRKFSLVLHGGEPLLNTPEQLSRMLQYATNKFEESNIEYEFGMQTNLTLMDENYAQVLRKFNVSVGVSFDGIKEANKGRTAIHQNKFEEKFKLMKDFGVKFGFLMVVSEANIGNIEESVEYLKEKYDIPGIKINYGEDVNNLGGEVEGKDFFEKGWKPFIDQFLSGKRMIERNMLEVIKRFLAHSVATVESDMKSNCGLKVCGGGINIIEMNPDGSVYLCGRYSEDYEDAYLMHVLDKDFLGLKQYKKYLKFVEEKHKHLIINHCDTCYADSICDHGCMAFHYSKHGEFGIRTDLVCDIFKPLHTYLVLNEFEIFKRLYEIEKKDDDSFIFDVGMPMGRVRVESELLKKISNELNLTTNVHSNDPYRIHILPRKN